MSDVTRRSFLKGASGIAAGGVLAAPLIAKGPAEEPKVKDSLRSKAASITLDNSVGFYDVAGDRWVTPDMLTPKQRTCLVRLRRNGLV